jgi:putative ABC transport system substrate-binding protein
MQAHQTGRRLSRRALVGGAVGLGASAAGLALLSGAGGLLPAAPWQRKVVRIGYLGNLPFDSPAQGEALKQRLRELGWVEGQNVVFDWRYSDNSEPGLSDSASELARTVDVVVVDSTPPAVAIQRANNTMPIVLAAHPDPVAAGLVTSLAKPGGTITGTGGTGGPVYAKRAELLKETVPSMVRLGVLQNPTFPSVPTIFLPAIRDAAERLGLELRLADARAAADVQGALEEVARWGAGGLLAINDPVVVGQQDAIVAFVAEVRLPAVYGSREWVERGGLMGFGAGPADGIRVAAGYVDQILRGAKPGDLPMQRPTVFEFSMNRATAAALGLSIPPSVAAQVTEWIPAP